MDFGAIWLVIKGFAGAAWTFLKSIPWQVWAALALALGVLYYGHIQYKDGYATAESHYLAHFKELERQREEATKAVQKAVLEHQKAMEALRAEHEKQLQAADAKRLRDLDALKRRLVINVTASNTRTCPDVPVAYLLHRHDAAAHANRVDRPEPTGAPAEFESESSGISLPTLAATDNAQADAFRQAVTWGEGWRNYALTTKRSCEATFKILTESK